MVDKSEKFSWLVRTGYFARAVLYAMLGFVALTSADKMSQGSQGIMRAIEDLPGGALILWIVAIGLIGYSLFRFASFFFDIENNGSDKTGWAKRIGHAGSGIGHSALAWLAIEVASDFGASGGGGGAEAATDTVLDMAFGGTIVGILGIIFFVVAAYQLKKAITGSFMDRIAADAPSATRALGTIGFAARTVVYAIIGWSLFDAGFGSRDAEGVRTLGDALASLAGSGLPFTLTAIGLLVFGLFSLVLARYRIIPTLSPDGRVPSFRA
ncbi:DUF1206 domain-containing protein [Qipengyuania nanhaisediminis]|uniref:DUF1206 domain-containing protein n=1 Tax=Qipengyuania nanhaisediminis TaxID=604088 RepID=UPI0038B36232